MICKAQEEEDQCAYLDSLEQFFCLQVAHCVQRHLYDVFYPLDEHLPFRQLELARGDNVLTNLLVLSYPLTDGVYTVQSPTSLVNALPNWSYNNMVLDELDVGDHGIDPLITDQSSPHDDDYGVTMELIREPDCYRYYVCIPRPSPATSHRWQQHAALVLSHSPLAPMLANKIEFEPSLKRWICVERVHRREKGCSPAFHLWLCLPTERRILLTYVGTTETLDVVTLQAMFASHRIKQAFSRKTIQQPVPPIKTNYRRFRCLKENIVLALQLGAASTGHLIVHCVNDMGNSVGQST